ncbi:MULTISPECIES: septum formation initiator family protein [unclassified Streptococcus]|uniref:septum formation initiator family protein n=1 Tax=unclassified Streptococcus TaxID=2608887 RepID=UPI001072C78C|nr:MULTISPECIES: septum formation initiator family protein [unclassified Streptococcus]MBF0805832.1 septum formation initiator family protein [Streptococcus sp. 19428wA2_WM07]TFU28630.1 septum formation initiator family protein [Streptococcus sp. WM07]
MPKNVLQMKNAYIDEGTSQRRQQYDRRRQRNRFIGWVLILVVLLFILPIFNLVRSRELLEQRQRQYREMTQQYQQLEKEEERLSTLARKLEDDDYASKYMRARYYYSKDGETIYTIPDLLPK